jgi:hypothetical protein
MVELSGEQECALIQETETSIFLIHEGLLALNSLSGANDFYHGPMQLLAQGFERLAKVVICLGQLESKGALPTQKEMKNRYSHDLVRLVEGTIDLSERTGYADSRPALRSDIDFVRGDQLLREMLSLLSAFGAWGRYYNLDTLLDPTGRDAARDDPVRSWQRMELRILNNHPEWRDKLAMPEFEGFYAVLAAELTVVLQRFVRTLCRFFTLGPLGDRGRRLQGIVSTFLFLRDEDLDTVPRRPFGR